MAFESISKWHTITIRKSVSSIEVYEFRYYNSLIVFVIREKTVEWYHVIDDVLFKETELIHYSSKKETPIVHPYALQEWDYWIYHYIRSNNIIEKVIHSKDCRKWNGLL